MPFAGDLEELEGLLERHPWREGDVRRIQSVEGEFTLELTGYYATVRLNLANGKINCWGALREKGLAVHQTYWEEYERDRLIQYLSRLVVNEGDSEAERLREEAKVKLERHKKMEHTLTWLRRLCVLAMVLVALWAVRYAKDEAASPSSIAQGAVFTQYHYTRSIGDALDRFDQDGEWFNISSKDALKDNGVAFAGWRGTCRSDSLLGQTENWSIEICFQIEVAGEDQYSIGVDRIDVGGYRLNRDNAFHGSTIYDILDMIYSNREQASITLDSGGLFPEVRYLSKREGAAQSLPSSVQPSPVMTTPELVPTPSPESEEDHSEWNYEDYVTHYGFDPADYGMYWYNESKSGPLDDFFDFAAQAVSEAAGGSRLYRGEWITDLTRDDLVGTWETERGIVFTIDRMGNEDTVWDYTIDLSESGLGLLGGGFLEDIYNVEEVFCGMSGMNGVTSYSVTYQYSTDGPEIHTWLQVEVIDSEGEQIVDRVPLAG